MGFTCLSGAASASRDATSASVAYMARELTCAMCNCSRFVCFETAIVEFTAWQMTLTGDSSVASAPGASRTPCIDSSPLDVDADVHMC